MIRDWIEKTITNENLKRALYLRMDGKLPEALAKLNQACDEKHGYAFFFKYRAHKYGGWGLYQNYMKAEHYRKLAVRENCPWVIHGDDYGMGMHYLMRPRLNSIYKIDDAIPNFEKALADGHPLAAVELFCLDRTKENSNALVHAVVFGDEETQHRLAVNIKLRVRGGQTSEPWFIKAANAKHKDSMWELMNKYYFESRFRKAAYWFMKLNELTVQLARRLTKSNDLRELFIYGRGYTDKFKNVTQFDRALRIYRESTAKAKAAVLCFTCCKFLSKDTRRVINEMVWKSREDPKIWGVFISK